MKKKIFSMLAVVLAAGILTGCGSTSLKDMNVEKYVTIGEYKGIAVTVPAAEVDEATWEEMVQQVYQGSYPAELGIADRAVEEGDTVDIDYVGRKDSVAFDGGSAAGAKLTIGSGQFIDGFEEGLKGVMPGETVDLNLTFPENYQNADLAGQEVVFTVTVNYIIPAEITDEAVAAMELGEDVDTVEEFRQSIYDYLLLVEEQERAATIQDRVMNIFLANCVFEEMPKNRLNQAKKAVLANVESSAAAYGLDAETFATYFYGSDLESVLETGSVESVQQVVAFQAVANAEGLNITDEELDSALLAEAEAAGKATVEEYLGERSKEDFREYYMCVKVIEFMAENAVVNE